jgi:hypothetical protein
MAECGRALPAEERAGTTILGSILALLLLAPIVYTIAITKKLAVRKSTGERRAASRGR